MKFKTFLTLGQGANEASVVELRKETDPPAEAPATPLGDITHVDDTDNLPGHQKLVVNHTLYHHIRELLFLEHGITDMSRVQLVSYNGGSEEPLPTFVNLTNEQFSKGIVGSVNTTKNADRTYLRGGLSAWAGMVTGKSATLTTFTDYTPDGEGLVEVSIDGAPFAIVNAPAGSATLFTDLPQASRFVVVRWGAVHGDATYVNKAGTVLAVTGDAAAVKPFEHWATHAGPAGVGATLPNLAGYSPRLLAPSGTTYTTNNSSVALRGPFKELVIAATGPGTFAYSKNGGNPVYVSRADDAGDPVTAIRIPCDGTLATYTVWNAGTYHTGGGNFSVSGDVANQLNQVGKLDQYGDSVTAGHGPGATPIHTETMRVAAALGMVGSALGIAGLTIDGQREVLDLVLPLKTITSNDVAILAIGGNSAGDGFDQTDQDHYDECIDKLKAAGYGKILCRGILPLQGSASMINPLNDILRGVAEGRNDPTVIFIDPRDWGVADAQDGVHPTMAGYTTIAAQAIPAYRTALGL